MESAAQAAQSAGLRRKDTTKGPPLRVLSLDGGGVRGYSMLILLQELMHRTFVEIHGRAPKRDEIPKPCEHFDLIAGTGTGGLIAIMLGRLRLDIETCKNVYVRMTKRVFETDKTFAGIPYRSTLFKASKLEEAIRECVSEHTVFEEEGNDVLANATPMTPMSPGSAFGGSSTGPQRSASTASRYSGYGMSPVDLRGPLGSSRWGNPNALLYDTRENRTKTAVTAVYKGTPKNGSSALLRSYDSRKEPAPEFNCTIWQAGRATCATGLAFKPIQIGQSVFIDDGNGKYNPAPQVLDEAVCNEWPGRELGVFISIGTGKRPSGTNHRQTEWWEGFVGSGMGDFAEARRRIIAKIEGCEETHQYMLREHLTKRQVNAGNYFRLNVEVGVGDFGMNEWHRLADISASTRMYLAKQEVQRVNIDASAILARIHFSKVRHERMMNGEPPLGNRWDRPLPNPSPSMSYPMAVELPAEDVIPSSPRQRPQPRLLSSSYRQRVSGEDKFAVVASDEFPQVLDADSMSGRSGEYRRSSEAYGGDPRGSNGSINPPRMSADSYPQRTSPPPLPPKTPIPYSPSAQQRYGTISALPLASNLPCPDTDGPPPVVNMARKPEYGVR
ncbi:hypothetical protein B0A49_11658 [Cryomyces minteri]|uniref:PNPLA domain-containing protein n=1 Tax=Cryomyces minteri TaxID=331657 RepID=A0A4U0WB31_9PEZI|nr:hypothetical protein B0A49_11658 [Cryomyces minteri]